MSDPTDIRDIELAGEKGAISLSVSNMKLAMVLLLTALCSLLPVYMS